MGTSGNPARRAAPKPRKRVRIVKVIVTPVVMIDDGETLTEFEHAPIVVSPADWPAYSSVQFPAELSAFEAQLNEDPSP